MARENKDKEKFIIKMKTDLAELKRKKVDLVKKAKQDQKKFAKIKLEKVKSNYYYPFCSSYQNIRLGPRDQNVAKVRSSTKV